MDIDTHVSTDTATTPLKVAVILASTRDGRFGPVVANWFLARAADHPEIETDLIDLAELDLPYTLSYRPSPAGVAQLAKVTPRLAAAEAFVVLTPEYNHSYPASLKNLMDWHHLEWQAKPVAFVSYGGVSGGLRAVEHLRQVFAELHAVTVRDTVSFHNAGALFDDEGQHKDPAEADAAAKVLLDQVLWWGQALREAKARRPYGA
ncbi:NAD(P)H-dependent oxidoreductase [Streptomyces sp. NBC_00654]|uniref:NADPH-dependent FMN reductase n=1 Tax=Streptomyces sp. NBC_00654 TaxID=2975799 RepID=UPI0022517959|nr:NAD(P)H-dependent oxidoreductase [Streptomyces sp. NBC_00654]MCX4969147.1 NAD(P)H-dependent oxidoreductase [Streptomyces sp. NBC_00654]